MLTAEPTKRHISYAKEEAVLLVATSIVPAPDVSQE